MIVVKNLRNDVMLIMFGGMVRTIDGEIAFRLAGSKLKDSSNRTVCLVDGENIMADGFEPIAYVKGDRILNPNRQTIGYVNNGSSHEKSLAAAAYVLKYFEVKKDSKRKIWK